MLIKTYTILRNSENLLFRKTSYIYVLNSKLIFLIPMSKNVILNYLCISFQTHFRFYFVENNDSKTYNANMKAKWRQLCHPATLIEERNEIPNSVWGIFPWHLMKLTYFTICKKCFF